MRLLEEREECTVFRRQCKDWTLEDEDRSSLGSPVDPDRLIASFVTSPLPAESPGATFLAVLAGFGPRRPLFRSREELPEPVGEGKTFFSAVLKRLCPSKAARN